MARITVEDCLERIDNRFDMTLIAAERARQIALGAEPLVSFDNDKPTVVALREIAEGLMSRAVLDQINEASRAADLAAAAENSNRRVRQDEGDGEESENSAAPSPKIENGDH